MKFKPNNKYFRWGLTAFCVVAASICFYYLMFHGSNIKIGIARIMNILMPVVVGLVIAYLLTPILNTIEYRVVRPILDKMPIKNRNKRNSFARGISIIITALLFFVLLYALISMFVSQIVPSIANLVSNFDTYVANVTQIINRLLDNNPDVRNSVVKLVNKYSVELETWLNNTVLSASSEILRTISLSILSLISVLWNGIIGFVISIYLLASKEKFAGQAKKVAYAIFDKDAANMVIRNFRFTHKTFIGFISGKVLDSIIIGLLCFIGTTLMNTPYAALVSVIIGITNVIPFFGPYMGAIPTTILIFLVDPTHPLSSVYFVIFILILQQIDGNIIGPKILGNSTGLTGFWVIFAITFFGGLFGVLGMIIGVPLFAVIYAAFKSIINMTLVKKGMPSDTAEYLDVGFVDDEGFHEYVPEYRQKAAEKKTKREQNSEKASGDKTK